MTKTAKEKWFDDHVIVMGPDAEREPLLRSRLREKWTRSEALANEKQLHPDIDASAEEQAEIDEAVNELLQREAR